MSEKDVRLPLSSADALGHFAEYLFGSLTRSDQRRWADYYIRGLLLCDGRKTASNMARALLEEKSAESLRQFVNRSPWDWAETRRRLIGLVSDRLAPQVAAVQKVIIPKNGASSVGVERCYVPAVGRVINCQTAFGLFLATPTTAVSVDWHLLLSGRWDTDEVLRSRALIPRQEIHRPEWQHVLELTADLNADTDGTEPIVAFDATDVAEVGQLAVALNAHGKRFVLDVSGEFARTELRAHREAEPVDGQVRRAGPVHHWANRAAGSLLRRATRGPSRLRAWAVRIPRPATAGRTTLSRETYQLITAVGENRHRLTNLDGHELDSVEHVLSGWHQAAKELRYLQTHLGLLDFEGRSFRGWHHHATLVSAAHAFERCGGDRLMPTIPQQQTDDLSTG
ncbi:IS701 family transposase [Kutzneria kofuensis]|uniref:Transposase IS701-like DDE domain-containing protein n=1 Tax=Kutzneria kofuensis TaxID=103725 RepID=A0A7W9KQR4_9PSEU|nr:transposase [Kutzneria kofuensis]MBB5897001.1 hypothetical protein [Kutzneria kofuensis]